VPDPLVRVRPIAVDTMEAATATATAVLLPPNYGQYRRVGRRTARVYRRMFEKSAKFWASIVTTRAFPQTSLPSPSLRASRLRELRAASGPGMAPAALTGPSRSAIRSVSRQCLDPSRERRKFASPSPVIASAGSTPSHRSMRLGPHRTTPGCAPLRSLGLRRAGFHTPSI
jgi:hypothetical protein